MVNHTNAIKNRDYLCFQIKTCVVIQIACYLSQMYKYNYFRLNYIITFW